MDSNTLTASCVEATVSSLGAATQRAAAQADEKEERKPAREAREKPREREGVHNDSTQGKPWGMLRRIGVRELRLSNGLATAPVVQGCVVKVTGVTVGQPRSD